MLPVLGHAALGGCRVGPLAEKIADAFGPTPAEREAMLPSGSRRVLHDRILWAKFEMSKAGRIASPGRGRFVATEAGKTLPASRPERIDVALPRMFPAFVEVVVDEDRLGLDRLHVQAERRGAGGTVGRPRPETSRTSPPTSDDFPGATI